MANDYIPKPDAKFHQWQLALLKTVSTRATTWKIPAEAVDDMINLQGTWDEAFTKTENVSTRTPSAVLGKNQIRKEFEAALRSFVREYLAANSAISDEERRGMGLHVRDTKPTPAPAPLTRPILEIDFSQQLRHSLRVRDSLRSGWGKPEHIHAFEICSLIGSTSEPPIDDLKLINFATKSPYHITYQASDQGKRVHYAVRWINSCGEKGPWSEIASAIIA